MKKIIRNAVNAYVEDLTRGTKESYKMMSSDEKKMFVRDVKNDMSDTIEDLVSDFNPELCMKMYSSYDEYDSFMRNKDSYWNYIISEFENTYREKMGEMLNENYWE